MELGLHLKKFNDRLKVMNQTNGRDITLSAQEARNIQADIFDLLTVVADLSKVTSTTSTPTSSESAELDGGTF